MELLRGREQVAEGGNGAGKGNQVRRRCWVKKREYSGGVWSPSRVLFFVRCSYCRYIVWLLISSFL